MIVGTCHFVNRPAALRYYTDYRYDNVVRAVDRKLREGEIHLGPPEVKKGERLFVNDEGRYCVVSKEK
jgi:hypothetical protein